MRRGAVVGVTATFRVCVESPPLHGPYMKPRNEKARSVKAG